MLLLFSLLSSLLVGGRSLNYDTPYKNERAFAALRDDGTLVLWGGSGTGEGLGIVPNVIAVASTLFAYAVIKADGTLLCSGSGSHGGNCPSPPANLRYLYSASHASAGGAFAAVDNVDAVFAWGGGAFGGDTTLVNDLLVPGVEFVNSFARGFAAYTKEGVLVPWSFESVGNRNSNFDDFARGDIVKTYGNEYAACALTASQTVFCWGEPSSGANEPAGLSNVKDLYYTDTAFAALKVDGSVVVWGHTSNGGSLGAVDATNVAYIFSTRYAFAALKLDDTVVAWGQGSNGGSIPGGTVSNVLNVFASDLGFVALKQDGSVFGWGYMSTPPGGMDPIVDIVTGRSAYAALSSTGKVYYWGEVGGYVITAATTAALASGTVSAIYSLTRAFAAVYGPNRNVVCWGWTSYGGDCSALSASLTGVKYIFGNEIRRTSVLNAPTPSPNNAPTANPSTAEPSMAPRRPTASPTWSMAPSRAPGGFALFPTASPSASPSAAPTVSDDPFITGSLNRNMTYYCRPRNYVSAPNGWQRIEPALVLLNSSGIVNATVWIEPFADTDEIGVVSASKGRSADPLVGVEAVTARGGAALSFYRAEGYSHPLDWQAVLRNAAYRLSDSLKPCSLYRRKYHRTFYFKVQDLQGRVSNEFAKRLTIETAVVVYTNANSGVVISQDQDLDVGEATGRWGDRPVLA